MCHGEATSSNVTTASSIGCDRQLAPERRFDAFLNLYCKWRFGPLHAEARERAAVRPDAHDRVRDVEAELVERGRLTRQKADPIDRDDLDPPPLGAVLEHRGAHGVTAHRRLAERGLPGERLGRLRQHVRTGRDREPRDDRRVVAQPGGGVAPLLDRVAWRRGS